MQAPWSSLVRRPTSVSHTTGHRLHLCSALLFSALYGHESALLSLLMTCCLFAAFS